MANTTPLRDGADGQLGYETWKAKTVVDSRDISYAFTNLIANDYYSFSALSDSGIDADK